MELQVFKRALDMPDDYIPSLADAEIECWWSDPFREFLKCCNPKCWKLHSIQDAYWSIKDFRERKNDKTHFCDCWGICQEIYPKEEFIDTIIDYIEGKVSVVLVTNESQEVRGFWVLNTKPLWDVLDFELATRPQSYDRESLLRSLSLEWFSMEDASQEEVTILHQIFAWEELRGTWYWKKILEELLELAREEKNNLILETRFNSNLYPITRSLWAQNLINDKYWYVVQILKRQLLVASLWKRIKEWFQWFKLEAMQILSQNPSFEWSFKY